MKVGNFKDLEGLDFNSQLLASELDTSVGRMKYIALSDFKSEYDIATFSLFWDKIRKNEVSITAISDNSDLYEIDGICLVLYEDLNNKILIFDVQDSLMVEEMIKSEE